MTALSEIQYEIDKAATARQAIYDAGAPCPDDTKRLTETLDWLYDAKRCELADLAVSA